MFQLLHSSARVARYSATKTLFQYITLKETIQIYYLMKKYLKHEMIWRQKVLLKQKVMLIFREVIDRASPTRDEQTDVNTKNPASVCRF